MAVFGSILICPRGSDNAWTVGSWQPREDECLLSCIPIEEVKRIIAKSIFRIV
jgi:hypothetical protein